MNLLKGITKHSVKIALLIFVLLYLTVFLSRTMFVIIPPGSAGVLFKTMSDKPLHEKTFTAGLHVLKPWNQMLIYKVINQKKSIKVQAMTKNGLSVKLQISIIFTPDYDRLPELVRKLGPDYDDMLDPVVESSVREIIGKYEPEALYTTAVVSVQHEILEECRRELHELPINIVEIVVEHLELPKSINQSIETKLRVQQEVLTYEYQLIKTEKEALRRKVEAEGIREFQKIVKSNLNESMLLFYKIKAIADLSHSENAKVVVIDGAANELPVMINAGK
jgi:regulator of protease activity HflC (stomatin/prohibitin superfamily)